MNSSVKELGSGLATFHETRTPPMVQIAYAPTEHGKNLLLSLSHIHFGIAEQDAIRHLQGDTLGITQNGDIWRKDEEKHVKMVLSSLDLLEMHETILADNGKHSLNEYEDEGRNVRIFARTLTSENGLPLYEVWLSKRKEDTQILIDALFCLHFHQTAADSQGNLLTETQIFEEAMRVGITFYMSDKGEALLPIIPSR